MAGVKSSRKRNGAALCSTYSVQVAGEHFSRADLFHGSRKKEVNRAFYVARGRQLIADYPSSDSARVLQKSIIGSNSRGHNERFAGPDAAPGAKRY